MVDAGAFARVFVLAGRRTIVGLALERRFRVGAARHRMKGPATASPDAKRRRVPKIVPLAGSILAVSALVGCAALGSATVAEKNDDALYGPSQSNLTSLSEVIDNHPSDPQAYNMRGS